MKTLGAKPKPPVAANSVADCLRAARKRIENPEKWFQGSHNSRRAYRAGKSCAWTAIAKGKHERQGERLLKAAIGAMCDTDVISWNDAPERTHAEVLEAFDRAIRLAEQETA